MVNYTEEYANRYSELPMYLNSRRWDWKRKDFPRVIALLEFRRYVMELNKEFKKILTFNAPYDPELLYLKYKARRNYNYEDNPVKYDLHTVNLEERDFDFCMVNQTFEHLHNPLMCAINIYNLLSENGIFYMNVPTLNIMHDLPYNFYTGFTPIGLGVMLYEAGFDILSIGQWGNRGYFSSVLNTGKWADYRYSSDKPGFNEMDYPIITWCFAKKNGRC